jgi:hypothetical protein
VVDVDDEVADFEIEEGVGGLGAWAGGDASDAAAGFVAVEQFVVGDEPEFGGVVELPGEAAMEVGEFEGDEVFGGGVVFAEEFDESIAFGGFVAEDDEAMVGGAGEFDEFGDGAFGFGVEGEELA